jgi:hypothetical protein
MSCNHPTPPSYMCHHNSTLSPHSLALDAVHVWLLQTHRAYQCRAHHQELHCIHDKKCNHINFLNHYYSILKRVRRKVPSSRHGGGHVSYVVPSRSASIACLLFSSTLAMWYSQVLGSLCLLCCSTSRANLSSSSIFFHCYYCSSRYTRSFSLFTLAKHQAHSSCLDSKDLFSKSK